MSKLCSRIAAVFSVLVLVAACSSAFAQDAKIEWIPAQVLAHADAIKAAAAEHQVDARVLSVMVLMESRGNPDAVSSSGAVGLMQIMPATAEKIAKRRGMNDHSTERLRDPVYNLDMGAWYLAQQIDLFKEEHGAEEALELAVTAYNSGPIAMRNHLLSGEPLSTESQRYRATFAQLWSERDQPHSVTAERIAN